MIDSTGVQKPWVNLIETRNSAHAHGCLEFVVQDYELLGWNPASLEKDLLSMYCSIPS